MKILLILFNILILLQPLFSQNANTSTNTNTGSVETIPLTVAQKRAIFIKSTLDTVRKKDLIDICKKLDLSTKGTKKELIIRIKSYLDMLDKEDQDDREKLDVKTTKDVIIIENADEGQYLKITENSEEILSAEGNVHLKYNRIRLKAEKVKVNSQTKEMICEGNVILYDGGRELTGEKIFYNLDTHEGIIYHGKSGLGELIYSGRTIKKVKVDTYIISKGTFTSCDEEHPHYYIEAKKMWVYPDEKIVLLDAYYVIADVKVFWIPFYMRFEKGTGIITSWGRRQVEGWYMQNTYRYRLNKTTKGNLKFDHYQRRGEYAGIDLHQDSEDSEILLSLSGAYDKEIYGTSNINPDTGKIDRENQGKVSFKNRLTFNRDSENAGYNTTIRASMFRQSDYSYIRDFEMYRPIKPGFHYNDSPIMHNDLYNQDVNKWYINLTDTRKNSSFLVKANWNFQWNPIIEEYRMNYANVPELKYTLSGVLWEKPTASASNAVSRGGFYPKIRYNTSIKLSHQDYFDENGNYIKALDNRIFDLSLSRAFNVINYISYTPSAGVGNQAYWAYDVDDIEKDNYERNTYSYGTAGQNLRLGPSSVYLNFNHALKYRFEEPPASDEYGKIVSHSLGMLQRTAPFSGFSYQGSTSYDLRTKRGEKLKGVDHKRFSDFNNDFSLTAIRNISISERYIYSIRRRKPLTSNFSFTYTKNDIPFFIINKIDQFQFNSVWNHNIQNPRNSNLSLNNLFKIKLAKYWKLNISTHSFNEKLYLYSKSLADKYRLEETENNAGEYEHRNFFVDLLNSINIFEPSKMKASYFKLKNANISIFHDLHCWEMGFGYTLSQRFYNYGRNTQYPYFEHSFWLRINMKIETELGVKEELQTEPPEIEE